MGDHSHHHHHNMDHSHHMMENTTATTTESLLGTIPSTTAATILQAVMTTMMSHDAHHLHRSPVESQHAGHNFQADSSSDVHATHLGAGGDHMQVWIRLG